MIRVSEKNKKKKKISNNFLKELEKDGVLLEVESNAKLGHEYEEADRKSFQEKVNERVKSMNPAQDRISKGLVNGTLQPDSNPFFQAPQEDERSKKGTYPYPETNLSNPGTNPVTKIPSTGNNPGSSFTQILIQNNVRCILLITYGHRHYKNEFKRADCYPGINEERYFGG